MINGSHHRVIPGVKNGDGKEEPRKVLKIAPPTRERIYNPWFLLEGSKDQLEEEIRFFRVPPVSRSLITYARGAPVSSPHNPRMH